MTWPATGWPEAPPPFGGLKAYGYDLIMADPPTEFTLRSAKGDAKSSQAQYGCMSFDDIAALPVGQLAAPNCILFLWWTWPHLFRPDDPERSIGGRIMKRWGFRYSTGGAWIKRTVTGKLAFGTGYRARSSCEPFLIGVLGSPDTNGATERNVIEGLRRRHSEKPEDAFAWCERYMPGVNRVELFSRRTRPGWDTWGYEAGKFDPVAHVGDASAPAQAASAEPGRAA